MSETLENQVRGGSGEMFDAIAERYDLLNRLISFGLDQGWRKRTIASLELGAEPTVLDLATGTGDLALMTKELHPSATVLGVDPSKNMLAIGAKKSEKKGLAIDFRVGDAQSLELEDASIDAITMAFGIRNVPDRPRALREMARVTKPGGRVAILELSEPKRGVMSALARFHIHTMVPAIGGAISGRREYGYLQRSIAAFPAPEEFAEIMRGGGLDVLEVAPLTFGVVCLYVATPAKKG